jgi:hypothetical protein
MSRHVLLPRPQSDTDRDRYAVITPRRRARRHADAVIFNYIHELAATA